jgi:hypothetical protein
MIGHCGYTTKLTQKNPAYHLEKIPLYIFRFGNNQIIFENVKIKIKIIWFEMSKFKEFTKGEYLFKKNWSDYV